MKTKSFLTSVLFLFLVSSVFISCSPNNSDDEVYDQIDKTASGKGAQSSPGGGGGIDPEDDNL